jgi:outer membrane protein assembly factor BamB
MNRPTIANGKVYVGTSSSLSVWGLTDYLYFQPAGSTAVLNWVTGKLLQANSLPGSWVTNPAVSPYTVAPTNTQMYYKLLMPGSP